MMRFHPVAALLASVPAVCFAQAMPQHDDAHAPAAADQHHYDASKSTPSTTLRVDVSAAVPGAAPLTLTLDDLRALPQATVVAHNGHSDKDEMYTGPLMADVLARAGLVLTPAAEHPMLLMMILAGGTDRYAVAYSAIEVQPTLHMARVIVALTRNGSPLDAAGRFQLVDTADMKPARWVHNLSSLTVRKVQP